MDQLDCKQIEQNKLKLFCKLYRRQLKLDRFRLRVTNNGSNIVITSPSENQWFIAYLDLNTWSYGDVVWCYVSDASRMTIESRIVRMHLNHVLNFIREIVIDS